MSLNDRDISIIVQSAGHDAAELLHANGADALPMYTALQASMAEQTLGLITQLQEQYVVETMIPAAFPGAQVVPEMPPMPGSVEQQLMVPPALQPPAYVPAPVPAMPPMPQPQYAPQMAYAGAPPGGGYQQAPPMAAPMPGRCSRCGGEMYDNTADNQWRRQAGFSLQPDYKCKNQQCENKIWPPDFQNFKHLPKPPARPR